MTPSTSILSSPAARLETRNVGIKIFFATDVQPVVLEACRRHNIAFDTYATKLGSNRAALVLILKGHDPVSRTMLDSLRGFVESARAGSLATSSAA